MEKFSWNEDQCIQILTACGQIQLLELLSKASDEEKHHLVQQVLDLDTKTPGGLLGYWERAKVFLNNSKLGMNPYKGFEPSVPDSIRVNINSSEFHEQESLGIEQMRYTWFVLVAGGLGERLGYSSIKVGLPLSILDKDLWYLRYYCEYILEFESRTIKYMSEEEAKTFWIPLAIMTSGDTHDKTLKLLESNNYFGMKRDQITFIKQELVPALIDNNATFSLVHGKLEIEAKPHGHGDVHTLLHQYGVIDKWIEMNKKWAVFFQDTNDLAFKAIPSAVGITEQNDFDMDYIWIERKPGDTICALTKLSNPETKRNMTIGVEYNQLNSFLQETSNIEGDLADKEGKSHFLGGINILIFKLSSYIEALNLTQGIIPEFVNPKYKDERKDVFKSSTRLEWMMQDFPKLLPNTAKIGLTCYERWICFSAVKNNLVDGVLKYQQGVAPETASTGEFDLFASNCRLLSFCGVDIEKTNWTDIKDFHGIKLIDGPKILIHPSFGVTLKELQDKFSGQCQISKWSALILKGQNTQIHNLVLDSTFVTLEDQLVDYEKTDKNYIKFIPVDFENEIEEIPEIIKIRGYRAIINEEIEGLNLYS